MKVILFILRLPPLLLSGQADKYFAQRKENNECWYHTDFTNSFLTPWGKNKFSLTSESLVIWQKYLLPVCQNFHQNVSLWPEHSFLVKLCCWDNCNLIAEDINQDCSKNFQTQASLRKQPKLLQESYNLFIRMMVTSLNNIIRDFCHDCILYSTFLSQRIHCQRLDASRINKQFIQTFTEEVYCWSVNESLIYTLALWKSLCCPQHGMLVLPIWITCWKIPVEWGFWTIRNVS